MDTVPPHGGDDLDLDALMMRVREAAIADGSSRGAARPQTAGDATGADIDLVRIIDAQGEWNEHTRQSLAALVECLRTLRDDWTEAHARLREELGQLSALADTRRTRTAGAGTPRPTRRRPSHNSRKRRP